MRKPELDRLTIPEFNIDLDLKTKNSIAYARHAKRKMGKLLVLGLGKTGQSVVAYCLSHASRFESITVLAGVTSPLIEALSQALEPLGVEVICTDENLEDLSLDERLSKRSFDVCITSPGIAPRHPLYQYGLKHSSELMSDVEWAWRESDGRASWVAITGTNGKTTTTALIHHLILNCGFQSCPVGNIGTPALDGIRFHLSDVYVVEMSSYQLHSCIEFAPNVAVLLNITPDHVAWHEGYENYQRDKLKIFENMPHSRTDSTFKDPHDHRDASLVGDLPLRINSCLVFDATCKTTRDLILARSAELKAKGVELFSVGSERGLDYALHQQLDSYFGCDVEAGYMVMHSLAGDLNLGPASQLQIKGDHNINNALCAASAVFALGGDLEKIIRALKNFRPLEHRNEPCGVIEGVTFYNDSKATNVDATLKALEAFDGQSLIMLYGGRDKNTPLGPLVEATKRSAVAVICYGEARKRFLEAFVPSGLAVYEVKTLQDAFNCALSIAKSGQNVVLSPACASFDEFNSYEQRGDCFKSLVAARLDRSARFRYPSLRSFDGTQEELLSYGVKLELNFDTTSFKPVTR